MDKNQWSNLGPTTQVNDDCLLLFVGLLCNMLVISLVALVILMTALQYLFNCCFYLKFYFNEDIWKLIF